MKVHSKPRLARQMSGFPVVRAASNRRKPTYLTTPSGRRVPYDRGQAGWGMIGPYPVRLAVGLAVSALIVPALWTQPMLFLAWVTATAILLFAAGTTKRGLSFFRRLSVDQESIENSRVAYANYVVGTGTRGELRKALEAQGKKLRAPPFFYYYFAVPILTAIVKVMSLLGPANKYF